MIELTKNIHFNGYTCIHLRRMSAHLHNTRCHCLGRIVDIFTIYKPLQRAWVLNWKSHWVLLHKQVHSFLVWFVYWHWHWAVTYWFYYCIFSSEFTWISFSVVKVDLVSQFSQLQLKNGKHITYFEPNSIAFAMHSINWIDRNSNSNVAIEILHRCECVQSVWF